jgi:beta-glucosidase/6-phospho-beta-glucosidase/beta-galactosidase
MNGFKTFFMGGFECADHINRSGERVDMLYETGHADRVWEDYALLSSIGIQTVREGISWSRVERQPFVYDFSEVKERMAAAQHYGIQQIWDICHFGYPDDLIPTHPQFARRFASVCAAFAEFHQQFAAQRLFVIPINEISFLSWHSGDVRGTVPFAINSGFDIKYHLCLAAIKGIEAIRQIEPEACIMLVEPLVKIHGLPGSDYETLHRLNEAQFQAMDMISGRICPELGGKPEYLQLLGFNYYYNNQWIHEGEPVCWVKDESRLDRLSNMLYLAYKRYDCPVILSETGHFGEDKTRWIQNITDECIEAVRLGVDLKGICIYPVIDRPDWDRLDAYCNCGIWHMDGAKNRIADQTYISQIIQCSQKIHSALSTEEHLGHIFHERVPLAY